jgi:hypothetical protein
MKLKRKRTLKKNTELYNYYYKKTGFYSVLFNGFVRLVLAIAIVILTFILLSEFLIFDFKDIFINIVENVPHWMVYVLFFLSDSLLLSIVPPDLFILWADSFENNFLILFLLALVSYAAGITSYFFGRRIGAIPSVYRWLNRRFSKLTRSVNKWGGAFIMIAAILPIPWSPAMIVTGIMNYSLKMLLLVALTRFARFFLYGFFLFRMIDIF